MHLVNCHRYSYLVTGETTRIRENGATGGLGVLATYAYDDLGRRTSVTFGNGVVQEFAYDPISRLKSLTNDLPGTANDLNATFAYTPASQIGSTTRAGDVYAWTGHFDATLTGTPNGLNQLTGYGGKALAHDNNGNVRTFGAETFGFSPENLMLTGPNDTILSYDPLLRLNHVSSGGATTRFAYDRLDRIGEYDANGALLRRYVHGPGIDEPLVWYEGSGTSDRRFLSTDERGSVVSLTNSSGNLLGINRYDEFGQPQSGNLGKWGYTGQFWVPEAGVWYYKARTYEPELGRFLQTDPIGYAGGVNLYAYVGNDPVNFTDPLGLRCVAVGRTTCPLTDPDPDIVVIGQPLSGLTASRPNVIRIPRGGARRPVPAKAQLKKLSICMQNFMNEAFSGFDWSNVVISSAEPMPRMAATNFGSVIAVGSLFSDFEGDKALLFHELAHSPQWASGELTVSGYIGSSVSAFGRSLAQAWSGRGFQSVAEMHDSIGVEQSADAVADVLLDAYDLAGEPCE